VFSWGWNSADQLGHGGRFEGSPRGDLPAFVQRFQGRGSGQPNGVGSGIAKVAAGRVHSVILTEDSEVYTWGSNKNGRLGTDEVPAMTAEPTKLHLPEELNVTRVIDVACGYDHTLLLVE